MTRFDIILTVWNRLSYTKRTVASLIDSGAVQDCERFIIVDNRSTEEGMEAFLHDLYAEIPSISGKVWLLRRGKNDGWATAVNDALGLSRAPLLFLVNNDVEFDLDFHKKMIEVRMNAEGIGLLAGWRHSGHRITVEHSLFDEMTDLPAVCWLLSKSAMEKAGMLKENGACLTKGGNGEDSEYVQRMRTHALVGAMKQDVAHHIDGY